MREHKNETKFVFNEFWNLKVWNLKVWNLLNNEYTIYHTT